MQTLKKFIPTLSQKIAYIPIRGPINSEMTEDITTLIKRIPYDAQAIAVVVSSNQGSFSQALIIAQKLRSKAQQRNISLFTFGEQYAINSGFLLLSAGHKVFVDKTTIIGGVQNGLQKLRFGCLSEYLKQVTYKNSNTLATEINSNAQYSENKKEELKQIFEGFSKQAKQTIRQFRKDKLKSDIDLQDFFSGSQAQQLGLVDGFGRLNTTMPGYFPKANIKQVKQNMFKEVRESLRRMKIQSSLMI